MIISLLIENILNLIKFENIVDLNSTLLASKCISALAQAIYLVNLVYNLITLREMLNNVGENFNMKMLIAFAPQIFLKITVIVIPLDIWTKSGQIKNYWKRWKEFQVKKGSFL